MFLIIVLIYKNVNSFFKKFNVIFSTAMSKYATLLFSTEDNAITVHVFTLPQEHH